MVSGGGGWGGGGGAPGTNIRPNEPKRTEDTNKLHELGGECLECLGGAVKEFVSLILYFFWRFFLLFSVQCRYYSRGETDATTEAVRGAWFTWWCSY